MDTIGSIIVGVSALFGVVAVVMGVRAARRVLRREACIRCGYPTHGLGVCPECGTVPVRLRWRRAWRLKWRMALVAVLTSSAGLTATAAVFSLHAVTRMPGWILVRVAPLGQSRNGGELARKLDIELDRRVRGRMLSAADDAELLRREVVRLDADRPFVVIPKVWNKAGAIEVLISGVRSGRCQGWGRINVTTPDGNAVGTMRIIPHGALLYANYGSGAFQKRSIPLPDPPPEYLELVLTHADVHGPTHEERAVARWRMPVNVKR